MDIIIIIIIIIINTIVDHSWYGIQSRGKPNTKSLTCLSVIL